MRRRIFEQEHDLFRESVRAFVDERLQPRVEEFRHERGFPRDVWLQAAAEGFLGLGVAEEYGGLGVEDLRYNVVLCEELARAALGFASAIGIHVDVVPPYLIELTSEAQRERWLPGVCSGEIVTAIAMTEPDAGSDLAALRTRAEPHGSGWVLNGSKTFITNGGSADLVVVAARTGESRRAITLFAVESTLPGYAVGQKLSKVGQHEVDTAEIFLTDVEVTAEHVLGEVDRGFEHMIRNLPRERLHTAYVNVAHAEAVLEATLEYVKSRRAFGRPVGTFQNSRFVLAEASTMLDVARAHVDHCILAANDGTLTDVDSAKAKLWASETQNHVIDACLQLHGGYGYMEEYAVARAWMDARVTKIWAGSNEIMKEIIGRSLGLAEPR